MDRKTAKNTTWADRGRYRIKIAAAAMMKDGWMKSAHKTEDGMSSITLGDYRDGSRAFCTCRGEAHLPLAPIWQ